ncbi:SWIM zinc finger family protein [Gallaecimonas xiamenensis]|uniref:Zinc finger SWIM domain protein n=1 Tax=Gallaecimonas xiamenensis 3-C-1 TaxID=745411 RepID=K2JFM9_9GAMM|nr:SWIM zinc finger family protein [Gallaecimonas xiamenensis]EKE69464.1 zinc finger SWIM domain protein [Gallaecimonas xiamenensis 3-C-1]
MNEALLTSLTSPGLVRRARKALEKAQPQLHPGHFCFEGHQGQLDWQHPANSRCDCGASGLCKHIVAAALYRLEQEQEAQPAPQAPAATEPELDLPALLRDAGKTRVRQLHRQSQRHWQADISQQGALVQVTLGDKQVHFRRATAMADLLCPDDASHLALLALYLYCQHKGLAFPWPDYLDDQQDQRQQLAQQAIGLLAQLARLGVNRLQSTALLELDLLLVPLARAGLPVAPLKQLKGKLEQYLAGQGIRDGKGVLLPMARTLAGLQSPPATQPQLMEQAPAQLLGLGSYPWQTDGGAHGLTLVLQDEQGRFICLTESRNDKSQALDYQALWRSLPLLPGAPSATNWQGRTLELSQGELSGWGRLRRRQDSRVDPSDAPLAPKAVDQVALIDWQAPYLLFAPSALVDQGFDQASQCMWLHYQDAQGQGLSFSLPYSPLHHKAVANLECLGQRLPALILARIERSASHYRLQPVSLLLDSWCNLHFDDLAKPADKQLLDTWLRQLPAQPASLAQPSALQRHLVHCLEQLADGPAGPKPQLAARSRDLGLATLARHLDSTDPLDSLRAAYIADMLMDMGREKPVFAG